LAVLAIAPIDRKAFMTSLLRRAAACAGLAACGISALSQAQSTTTILPERTTELRRALPVPTVAAAPIVQQSPNGLYKLSITDTGIELLGPKGTVRITDTGIEITGIHAPVDMRASDMNVRIDRTVRLEAGMNMDIRAGSNMDIRGSSAVQIAAAAGASLLGSTVTLGCNNGKAVARVGDLVNTTVSPAVSESCCDCARLADGSGLLSPLRYSTVTATAG
jgi:hypothetical protein